jgi:hypothetical protein
VGTVAKFKGLLKLWKVAEFVIEHVAELGKWKEQLHQVRDGLDVSIGAGVNYTVVISPDKARALRRLVAGALAVLGN